MFTGAIVPLLAATVALEIPLVVEEPIGVDRQGEPVTAGICFPKKTVPIDACLSLWDADTAIPLQVTPLVEDPPGWLRWALLDFQINLSAGQQKKLTLRTKPATVTPAVRLAVSENSDQIVVNTGPISVTLRKKAPFSLFDTVRVGKTVVARGGTVGFESALTGNTILAGSPMEISWEYRGPLRATLCLRGFYNGQGPEKLKYVTRLTFWAGKSYILVEHLLCNSNSQQIAHVKINRAWLSLRHQLGSQAMAIIGTDRKIPCRLEANSTVWLHQGKHNRTDLRHYKLSPRYGAPIDDATRAGCGNDVLYQGADSDGWIALRGPSATLLIADRYFRGDPPRRLQADDEEIVVEYVSSKFAGRGEPFVSDSFWLFDCSHKRADILIDFGAGKQDFTDQVAAWRERLLALAPGEWYAKCDVLGVGPFGTLEDEISTYRQWGWSFKPEQLPHATPMPWAFVTWEDNHYESESDSTEALLLMALRTGQRGYFDLAEAWGRYHADMHAWRSDGWHYDDGAIWFPHGGPQGTRPARQKANITFQHWNKGSPDDRELWRLCQAKACYCHFYGAGLVDLFLLTGQRDYLEAAIDLAEQKQSEWIKHRQFKPGKVDIIHDTRGFGRGFYVITHLAEAVPQNQFVRQLAFLARDVLWHSQLDERGFAPCHIGTGFGGFDLQKHLPEPMKRFMEENGISIDAKGWLTDAEGNRWPVACIGGTWQHFYVHAAAERFARVFHDEDMADFAVAFGRFVAKYLLSKKCKQVHYYTYMDVPLRDRLWDPWEFLPEHLATTDGDGCIHDGYYTRHFPDVMAKAYSLTGDVSLLAQAKIFWHYGSKRGYRTRHYSAGWNEVGMFANHRPPKDDTALTTARMFYEYAHPRADVTPPEPVKDLSVKPLGNGSVRVEFTAPADTDGRVVRYQLKFAELPIVAYDEFSISRDQGRKRNFWRAQNVTGEPHPGLPGQRESFVIEGLPSGRRLFFVLVSYDNWNNRSRLSNIATAELAP